MRTRSWILVSLSCAIVGCSGGTRTSGFGPGSTDGGGAQGSDGGSISSPSGDGGVVPIIGGGTTDGGGGAAATCTVTNPDGDMDKDGWSPNQGDCNDCDPNVNPGAIDVLHTNDGGAPTWGDEDCDGKAGDSAMACDQGLALDDVSAADGARAIELCMQATSSDRKYGVLSAAYVRADGAPFATPGLQVGIQSAFGSDVHVQGGQNMLALSTGHARAVGQAGAYNGISCEIEDGGTPPPGFPQDDPSCPPTKLITDDVALEVQVRVPSNATGFSFSFKFHSFEFPDWVCDTDGYNDQFITLVTPPPAGSYVPTGSAGGNISFDSNKHPVGVNLGFFDVCDPTTPTRFASHCNKTTGATCPAVPSPYCPLGVGELAGTGFDVWQPKVGPDGATRWLQTQAPATGGSTITIRFAIWDAGNGQFDSTVLIDNFQWVATGGTVAVGTTPVPAPK